MTGILYGLGVGPGDPELITLKAHRILRSVPVVAYPAPDQGDSLARAIVADYFPGGQTEIVIRTPMSLNRFPALEVYDKAAAEVGTHLDAGRDVAILCEGDPFFYGSFMYLYARLAERYRVEIVPGVSSLMACAARTGAPLAARNDILAVLPALLPTAELEARIAAADGVAILKVGKHFSKIRDLLVAMGIAEHCRYVERATMASERILPLDAVMPDTVPYFSMILIHKRGQAWQ